MVSCKRIPSSCIHFRLKFPACLLGGCFFVSRFSRPRGWRWSTCLRSRGLHRCLGWVHPNSFSLKKNLSEIPCQFHTLDKLYHPPKASEPLVLRVGPCISCVRALPEVDLSTQIPGLMKPKQGPRRRNLPTRSSTFSPYRISSNIPTGATTAGN